VGSPFTESQLPAPLVGAQSRSLADVAAEPLYYPAPPSFYADLKRGDNVDCLDTRAKWRFAEVSGIRVHEGRPELHIHYVGEALYCGSLTSGIK